MIAIGAGILLLAAVMIALAKARDSRPRFATIPHQERAIDAVWHGVFAVPRYQWCRPGTWGNRAPSVDWVQGERLNHRGKAWIATLGDGQRGGVAGLSHATHIQVALPPGQKFSDSALCHELYHSFMRLRTGDPDHYHRADYRPVIAAEFLLRDMGL